MTIPGTIEVRMSWQRGHTILVPANYIAVTTRQQTQVVTCSGPGCIRPPHVCRESRSCGSHFHAPDDALTHNELQYTRFSHMGRQSLSMGSHSNAPDGYATVCHGDTCTQCDVTHAARRGRPRCSIQGAISTADT
eukprot:6532155-Pyramimonas_sp.AAC.1